MSISLYNSINLFISNYKANLENYEKFIYYDNLVDYKKKYIINVINEFDSFYKTEYIYFNNIISRYITEYNILLKQILKVKYDCYTNKSKEIIINQNIIMNKITKLLNDFIKRNNKLLSIFNIQDIKDKVNNRICDCCEMENSYNEEFECIYCGYITDNTNINIVISKKIIESMKRIKCNNIEIRLKEFTNKLNELQNKYNPIIPNILYEKINQYINNHNILKNDINISLIREILKNINYVSYYKYDKIIIRNIKKYSELDKKINPLSENHSINSCTNKIYEEEYIFTNEQETKILNEFNIFNNELERYNNSQEIKIKMPDFNYIIYNILMRLGIKCKTEHFDLAKTLDKQTKQENIMRILLKNINWKFYPFF